LRKNLFLDFKEKVETQMAKGKPVQQSSSQLLPGESNEGNPCQQESRKRASYRIMSSQTSSLQGGVSAPNSPQKLPTTTFSQKLPTTSSLDLKQKTPKDQSTSKPIHEISIAPNVVSQRGAQLPKVVAATKLHKKVFMLLVYVIPSLLQ